MSLTASLCQSTSEVIEERGGKTDTMQHVWEERDDEVASGVICPMPDCGALAVAYRPPDRMGRDNVGPWEFTCPRCDIDFTVAEDELIFQSVPKGWLLAKVHAA